MSQNCLVQSSLLQYPFSLHLGTCSHETVVPSSPYTSNRHQVAGPWQSQQRYSASHWMPGLEPSKTSQSSSWIKNHARLHLCRRYLETTSQMKVRPCQRAGYPSWDSLSRAPSAPAYGQVGTEGRRAISGLCNLLQLPAGLHMG